jgi:hypothetical protein
MAMNQHEPLIANTALGCASLIPTYLAITKNADIRPSARYILKIYNVLSDVSVAAGKPTYSCLRYKAHNLLI